MANICWIIEKAREFQRKIYFCVIDYTKSFHYVDHTRLWKIPKETVITGSSSLSSEKPVYESVRNRPGYRTTDWFKIGKSTGSLCIVPCLFKLYAEYIM